MSYTRRDQEVFPQLRHESTLPASSGPSLLYLTICLLWCRRICHECNLTAPLVLLTEDRRTMTSIFLLSMSFFYQHWSLPTEGNVIWNGWARINIQSIVRFRTAATQPWMVSLKFDIKFPILYTSLPSFMYTLFFSVLRVKPQFAKTRFLWCFAS